MTPEPEVLARVQSGLGRLTLNRPKALHALNRAMCQTMIEALLAWQTDDAVKSILIDHAAAVFASNYLVTVLDASLRAYQAAGVPEDVARELARPLAEETLANVFRLGPAAALSGPVARGDFATVARQQAALNQWDAPTGQLYEALVAPTTGLAGRKPRPN